MERMPAPNPQKRQPHDHQELPQNNIDSNCSKDLQPDAPKKEKTQHQPSLEKKTKTGSTQTDQPQDKYSPSDVSNGRLKSKNLPATLLSSSTFQKPLFRSTPER